MKIEGRRQQIRQALEQGVDSVRKLIESKAATPAEVQSVLEELGDRFETKSDVEKLLGGQQAGDPAMPVAGGRKVHDVRAEKKKPWWTGVSTPNLGAPLFPEPTQNVDAHGERFTKDDVASALRSLAPR